MVRENEVAFGFGRSHLEGNSIIGISGGICERYGGLRWSTLFGGRGDEECQLAIGRGDEELAWVQKV